MLPYRPQHLIARLLVLITVSLVLPQVSVAKGGQKPWIVNAKSAKALIESQQKQGNPVTILDVRSRRSYNKSHVEGAYHIDWQAFSKSTKADRGKLLSNANVLTAKLRRHGVWQDRPVLVIGDPLNGWGEDGRIVWMLRHLGHKHTALVDGGHDALKASGVALSKAAPKPTLGDFRARPIKKLGVNADDVKAMSSSESNAVILDTREPREYAGKTPYGESRGGHVPGAKPLYYKDLLDKKGMLKSRAALTKVLAKHGITSTRQPVVAYCTGGVRSAWVIVVLHHLGYTKAANYAGSMWEWSSLPAETFTLQK